MLHLTMLIKILFQSLLLYFCYSASHLVAAECFYAVSPEESVVANVPEVLVV